MKIHFSIVNWELGDLSKYYFVQYLIIVHSNIMFKMLGLQYGLSLPNFCFVQENLQIQALAYIFEGIDCHGYENSKWLAFIQDVTDR